jgi:hypothetical protein
MMKLPFRSGKIISVFFIGVLFYFSFNYFLSGYRYFDLATYHYDEGIVAYGAVRILDGGVPYRDFWTLYAPGEFFTLAAIFKIFGISLKAAVLFAVTVLSFTVCSIYLLINKLCSRIFAVLAFLFALFWLKSYMVFNRPGQLAILFFVLCSLSLIKFLNSGRNIWLVATGVLAGMVGLFRQDFGLYILISASLVILLKQLNSTKKKDGKLRLSLVFKSILFLLAGSSIIILPLFIYLIGNSAFREFINDVVVFPVTIYPRVRDLPFPELKADSLIFYLPASVFLLAFLRLLFYNWKTEIKDIGPWVMLFFLFSGMGFLNYTNTRACMSHLLPTMIPAIVLFIWLSYNLLKKFFGREVFFYEGLAWAVVCFTLFFYLTKPSLDALAKKPISMSDKEVKEALLNIDRGYGFYDNSEHAQSQVRAIKYIQDKTEKKEKIFVGNLRHDKVVNSDVIFYFFSARDSATKYYELHPGLTNTQKIQKEIINDLSRKGVRYIVLWSGSESAKCIIEPNESSKSSGVRELDTFIKENYKIEKIFGPYLILKRYTEFLGW